MTLNFLLPPPPEYWDYKYVPACQVYVVLGIKPRTLCMPGKHSIS